MTSTTVFFKNISDDQLRYTPLALQQPQIRDEASCWGCRKHDAFAQVLMSCCGLIQSAVCSRVISYGKSPAVLFCFHVCQQVLVLQGPDKGKVGNELVIPPLKWAMADVDF